LQLLLQQAMHGELFDALPLLECFILAVIQREIERVRKMEMAREIEIEGWRWGGDKERGRRR
jgi:hypothetical protein